MKKTGARDGSKTAQILDLLRRSSGVTTKELLKLTAWQAHSLRGFLSGTVGKKMGLKVTSTKGEDGGIFEVFHDSAVQSSLEQSSNQLNLFEI